MTGRTCLRGMLGPALLIWTRSPQKALSLPMPTVTSRVSSRSAIMSGIRPSTSGNYINKNSLTHNPILNKAVLLPKFFQQHGYYVSGAGKLFHGYHFNYEVKGRGFDEYYPSKTQDLPSFEGLKFSSKFPWVGGREQPTGGLSVQMSLWMTILMGRQQIG